MNRHILVSLMLMVLALMLFNIGGSADQRGGESGSLSGEGDEVAPSTQQTAALVGEAAAPLPEFSPIGVLFAIVLALIAYFFIRKQKSIFTSN